MTKVKTMNELINEYEEGLIALAKAEIEEENRISGILKQHPEIGTLYRNGKTVYYTNFPYKESKNISAFL